MFVVGIIVFYVVVGDIIVINEFYSVVFVFIGIMFIVVDLVVGVIKGGMGIIVLIVVFCIIINEIIDCKVQVLQIGVFIGVIFIVDFGIIIIIVII